MPPTSLSDRKIIQWTIAYLVSGWGVLQVLSYLSGLFGWPDAVQRAALVTIAVGAFAAVVVAWYHGERGDQRVTRTEAILVSSIVLVAGAAGAFVYRTTPINADTLASQPNTVASRSVAVLPFANMSSSAANDWFSDGITQEILDKLGKVPGLRVVGRTSAFGFRDAKTDPRKIGRQLGVLHVLRGSLQRVGNTLRIKANLISTADGRDVWNRSFDGDIGTIFAIEDSISNAIADVLNANVQPTDVPLRATNLNAHDLYLLGVDRWSRRTSASLNEARDYFTTSIRADTMYAAAYAGLALTYSVLSQYDAKWNAIDAFRDGRIAASRALEIDPTNAEAHAALSQIGTYTSDFPSAEREARKAIELNPNYSTAHQWLAETLISRIGFRRH